MLSSDRLTVRLTSSSSFFSSLFTLLVCRAEVADSGLVILWVLTDPPDSVLTVVMLGPLGLRLTDSVREGALAKAARALAPSMSAWSVGAAVTELTGGFVSFSSVTG